MWSSPIVRRICGLLMFVLTCVGVTGAEAAPILIGGSQTWMYDGTTVGCSTCSAMVQFELLTATSLKVSFENTSTDGQAGLKILTGVGFNTDPNLNSISILSQSIEGGKVWKLSNGTGGGSWEIGLFIQGGINSGLDNQSPSLNSGFMILGWTSPSIGAGGLSIDNSITKFQAAGPNDLSLQAPGIRVTEPGSLALLGMGLAVLLRRRVSAP